MQAGFAGLSIKTWACVGLQPEADSLAHVGKGFCAFRIDPADIPADPEIEWVESFFVPSKVTVQPRTKAGWLRGVGNRRCLLVHRSKISDRGTSMYAETEPLTANSSMRCQALSLGSARDVRQLITTLAALSGSSSPKQRW